MSLGFITYHPQSNGQAKISSREIKNILAKMSMQVEKTSEQSLMIHCELIELLISPLLECHHTRYYLRSTVIYL